MPPFVVSSLFIVPLILGTVPVCTLSHGSNPSSSSTSTYDDDKITPCQPYRWGPNCNRICLKNCLDGRCDISTGICIECKNGSYRLEGDACLGCLHGCDICSSGSNCDKCNTNKYGIMCEYNCAECVDNKCNTFGCIRGCKSGLLQVPTEKYDGDPPGNYTRCLECIANCELCDADSPHKCTRCKDGYYLKQITTVSSGSSDTICEKSPDNWEATREASISKPPTGIDNGAYTEPGTVVKGEHNGEPCYNVNASCTDGCDKCYWGPFCNKSCGVGCTNGSCNQSNGYCTCDHNYWGEKCNRTCDVNCPDPRNGSQTCSKVNGTCLFESETFTVQGVYNAVQRFGVSETLYLCVIGIAFLLLFLWGLYSLYKCSRQGKNYLSWPT